MLFFIPRINSNKETFSTLSREKKRRLKEKWEKIKLFLSCRHQTAVALYRNIFAKYTHGQCITTILCYMSSKKGGKTWSLIWHTILGNTLHFLSGICILQRHTTTHMIIEYPIFYYFQKRKCHRKLCLYPTPPL